MDFFCAVDGKLLWKYLVLSCLLIDLMILIDWLVDHSLIGDCFVLSCIDSVVEVVHISVFY